MTQALSLGDSLLVTLVGLSIVFAGLIILICLIKVLVTITTGTGKKKEAPKAAAPAAPAAAPAPAAAAVDVTDDDALIAVITAAVACMMDEGSAFTVRRVRRISNAPAWQKAGREEQVYSRF